MQNSPRSSALSPVAIWLNRLIGDALRQAAARLRLPEQVQDQAACKWLLTTLTGKRSWLDSMNTTGEPTSSPSAAQLGNNRDRPGR